MDSTDRMIEFCLKTDLDQIPEEVVAESALSFANTAGVAIAALGSDTLRTTIQALATFGGEGQAHLFGADLRTSVDRAAFINGLAAHLLDFDDTHLPTIYHPTAVLFGALMPLSEWRDLSGEELLAAWTVGVELGTRVALALGSEHYNAGWHITATAGAVASAFVSGRALGLSHHQMRHCVSIASARASGHRVQFGSMMKAGQVGFAASNGVVAAVLAAQGFTAAAEGLTGRNGLIATEAPHGDRIQLAKGLGSEWLVLDNRIKPYASGVVTHPVIDLGREVTESGIESSEIAGVRVLVHPLVQELTGNTNPTTGLEGKFSATHCFSVGAILGSGAPRAFSDEAVMREDIARLRGKCQLVVEADRRHMTAAAEVTVGRISHYFEVLDPRGGPDRPLTPEEVQVKFVDAVTGNGLLTHENAESWFRRLTRIAAEPSMRTLVQEAANISRSAN